MRAAALNTGSDFHLLDHIAPLAAILDIPLIVTEEKNHALAKRYYPMTSVEWMPYLDRELQIIADRFDALIECKYWLPHLKSLFKDFYRKDMQLIFCPHGQSDKGYGARLLHPYALQDHVLLYGDLMKSMLGELGIRAISTQVGNYRLAFYVAHQSFYDSLAEAEIFSSLSPSNRTLLYAPTWKDADEASTFFTQTPGLLAALPSDWNLIVKIHPLLELREPAQFYRIAGLVEANPRARLIAEFPPIYPLLGRCDAYLGDYSSVGYDFLYYQKPMFFLTQGSISDCRIHACGIKIDRPASLFSLIDSNIDFKTRQSELYSFAFGPCESIDSIRDRLFRITRGKDK